MSAATEAVAAVDDLAIDATPLDALARGAARRAPPRLRGLASAVSGLIEPDALVAREGRVVVTDADGALIAGLGAAVRPGDLVEIAGVPACVIANDARAVRAVPDDPVRCDAPVRPMPRPPRADRSWLGRVLDARLHPLDGGTRPAFAPLGGLPVGPEPDAGVQLGIGCLDLFCDVRVGEAWAVAGGPRSERRRLLSLVAAAERMEALVRVAVAPSRRETLDRLADPGAGTLLILGRRGDGPAAASATLDAAARAAVDLRADGDVLLLVEDAERVPAASLRRAAREAVRAGVTVVAALDAEPDWADGVIALDPAGEVDWPKTLDGLAEPSDPRLARMAADLRARLRAGALPSRAAALLAIDRGIALPDLDALDAALALGTTSA